MERRDLWLCVLSFLLFAEASSWLTGGPNSALCLLEPQNSEQAFNDDQQKDCPTFFAGSLLLGHRGFEWIKRDDNDKAVVAGFTIVLAISTIGLWLATNKLWAAGERQLELLRESSATQSRDMQASIQAANELAGASNRGAAAASKSSIAIAESNKIARESAERQIRAYISVQPYDFEFLRGTNKAIACTAKYKIHNAGQTPAHHVRTDVDFRIAPWPLTESLAPLKENMLVFDRSVGPGETISGSAKKGQDISELRDGMRLYLIGCVKYRDVFERNRETWFCGSFPEAERLLSGIGRIEISFANSERHNEAT